MTEETRTASLLEAVQVEQTLEREIAALEKILPQCSALLAAELEEMASARRTLLSAVRGEIEQVAVAVPEAAERYLPGRDAEEPVELPATKG